MQTVKDAAQLVHWKWPRREGWPPLRVNRHGFAWAERQVPELWQENERYPWRVLLHEEKAKRAKAQPNDHYWHSARGAVHGSGLGSQSEHRAPLATQETLAWTWHHPVHRWATILTNVNIDGAMNIYLTSFDAIRKFNSEGRLLWQRFVQPSWCTDSSCLAHGALYSLLTTGEVFALDIEDGDFIWVTRVSYGGSMDNGFVTVHDGYVLAALDVNSEEDGGSFHVFCLSDEGEQLWKFKPESPLWNFCASFTDFGTTVFQDFAGRVYHLRLRDGELLWRNGGVDKSWTDGTFTLGPNGVAYAVAMTAPRGTAHPHNMGTLTALRVKDGALLWQATTPEPPNNAPAVAHLGGEGAGLSVVQPIGMQCSPDAPTGIQVFDALTGELQWEFCGPKLEFRNPNVDCYQAADPQGKRVRLANHIRDQSAPNPWCTPSVGADGTIYIGNQDGQCYCLRRGTKPGTHPFRQRGHWHGTCAARFGSVDVWAFDVYSCFGGSAAPAIAPGLLAVATIDALYVFKDDLGPSPTGAGST